VLHDEPYDIRHVFAYATRVKGSCRFDRATMPQAIGTESKPLRCEDVSLRISFRWRVTFIGFFIPVCRHDMPWMFLLPFGPGVARPFPWSAGTEV